MAELLLMAVPPFHRRYSLPFAHFALLLLLSYFQQMHDNFLFFIALFTGGIIGLITSLCTNKTIASVLRKMSDAQMPSAESENEQPSLIDLLQGAGIVLLCCVASLLAATEYGISFEWGWVLLLSATLILLAVVDIRTYRLPDAIVFAAVLIAMNVSLTIFEMSPYDMLLGAGVASSSVFVLGKLYSAVSGRVGIGLGDVKLLVCCGAISGLYGLPELFFVAFVLASVWILLRVIFRIKVSTDYIPMAPFLIAGTLYQILF